MKEKFVNILLPIVVVISLSFIFTKVSNNKMAESIKNKTIDNTKKFSISIDEYNKDIQSYADYVNSLGLSDLQIIMKVMKDQWANYHYEQDKSLITGYYRLSFQDEGYGVCTSFADDFTAKINAINPAYEARNVICYADFSAEEVKIVDIERVAITSEEKDDSLFRMLYPADKYGNHMVSMMKIPEKDYCLVVDTTNLMIGTIKNGEIYIFNTSSTDTLEYVKKGNYIMDKDNGVTLKDINYKCVETIEDINYLYGYEQQIKALEEINEIESTSELKRVLKR